MQEKLYQRDRELDDSKMDLDGARRQAEEAKRTILDQEHKIQQVEQSYD